jgi:FMN phosphatase YigB (HAD superfamily)
MADMPLTEYLATHPEKKFLIFDFDETLFHIHLPWGVYKDRKNEILKAFDEALYEEKAREDQDEDLVNIFIAQHGEAIRKPLRDWSLEFETEYLIAFHPNVQLLSWLEQHREEYRFFIWSNNCTPTIERALRDHTMNEWFQEIVGKDKVEFGKPRRDGFELIFDSVVQQQGSEPEVAEFLMTGNSLQSDKRAAEASGIDFFLHEYSVPYLK